MIGRGALIALVAAERTHQWLELGDAALPGPRSVPRSFLAFAVVVGFGEGLGAWVGEASGFWSAVFFCMAAHISLTGFRWLGDARARRGARPTLALRLVDGAAAVGVFAVPFLGTAAASDDPAAVAWFGRATLPAEAARAAALVAPLLAAPFLVRAAVDAARGAAGAAEALVVLALAAGAAAQRFAPGLLGAALVLVVVHSAPCAVFALRGRPAKTAAARAALALAIATTEPLLVSWAIDLWPRPFFPLSDAAPRFGSEAGLLLFPLWMTPFFVHVIADARRCVVGGAAA